MRLIKFNFALKRIFDVCISFFGIIILLPLFLLIAVLIKITSKGPVLFKQKRLGKDGKAFDILKFRTMVMNAEKLGTGVKIDSEKDARITRFGRLLRLTSLDELPQLFNVLEGTMSLVGPRPPVTYYPYSGYESYPKWAKKRFKMRPGITGLAQATVRNSKTWEERMVIDNQYIDHFNIIFDIKILLLTVKRVICWSDIYRNNSGL